MCFFAAIPAAAAAGSAAAGASAAAGVSTASLLTYASLGLGAISTIAQFAQQYQAAQAMEEQQRAIAEAERLNYLQQANRQEVQWRQARKAAAQEALKTMLEKRRMEAAIRVRSAEAGVSGLSVDALLADVGAQAQRRLETIGTNLGFAYEDLLDQRAALRAGSQRRLAAASRPIQYPSLIDLGINLADTGLRAYEASRPRRVS